MKISDKSVQEIRKEIVSLIFAAANPIGTEHKPLSRQIGGGTLGPADDIYINWDRAWALNAKLTVQFVSQDLGKSYRVQVEIGHSATSRGLANAVAFVKLLQEVIDLGALIEARFDGNYAIAKEGEDE